jgi:hypothetical protein
MDKTEQAMSPKTEQVLPKIKKTVRFLFNKQLRPLQGKIKKAERRERCSAFL